MGYEVDQMLVSSSEVTNEWNYNSVPSIRLRGLDRENFTFTFYFLQSWHIVILNKTLPTTF